MAIGRIPEPGTGIPESIVDAKGDIITATAADTPARLAVGTNNQTLIAASGEATGLKYANGSVATLTAKGDLLTATAANTISRLAVGANGTTLVADSAEATGLKWAAPSSGGSNYSLLNSGGTSLSGTTTTISGISAKDKILILIVNASTTGTFPSIFLRLNTDTASNYTAFGGTFAGTSMTMTPYSTTTTSMRFSDLNDADASANGYCFIQGASTAGQKIFNLWGAGTNSNQSYGYLTSGFYNSASTISSISVCSGNTFDGGTVYVYTSAS
jgi:hypothetical protein